jgi:hypothetical protein
MGTYYKNVENYLDKIDNGAWVEIGTDRGEGSTKFFADLAQERGVDFFGVDADPDQIDRAHKNLSTDGKLPNHVTLTIARGEDFLDSFPKQNPNKQISLVYLDNFDWNYWLTVPEEPFVPGQRQHYREKMGIEMLNMNSQITHLVQAMRLIDLMTPNSIVVCDDTWFEPREGIFIGKCAGALPYLMIKGYTLLHYEGYRNQRGGAGAVLGKFK